VKNHALDKPVVARVNGDAIAGGAELLAATDIRIAADHARFGLQEPRWGLMPGGGSTVRLPRQIPYCHAMDILLTGRIFGADEALRIGLVNRVVPGDCLDDAVEAVVRQLLRNGPAAMRNIKRAVLASYGLPDREAFQIEADAVRKTLNTHDAREGPRAFVEKRDPVFRAKLPAAWLEMMIPWTPWSTAIRSSAGLRIPFSANFPNAESIRCSKIRNGASRDRTGDLLLAKSPRQPSAAGQEPISPIDPGSSLKL